MKRSHKIMLFRIILSAVLFAAAAIFAKDGWMRIVMYLIPYAVIGYDIIISALKNIFSGHIFDENFLMTVASVGAICLGEYPEALAVMLFYQVGELFQSIAVANSRRSITALMNIRPDYANIEINGEIKRVSPADVSVGDTIIIKAGERVPLDGIILEGKTSFDTAALTGEAMPRIASVGDEALSGFVNTSGLIKVKVTKLFSDSTVSKILDLVQNSAMKKAKTERFITRFSRYYTPIVVGAAVLIAVLPPLFTDAAWTQWINTSLIFLVISCPCALVISVPLTFFGGIGRASKSGILVKGSNYLEMLADTRTFVFDKTGTLTDGFFTVSSIHPVSDSDKLLDALSVAEAFSDHPLAIAVHKHSPLSDSQKSLITDYKEIAGKGTSCLLGTARYAAGNASFMAEQGIKVSGAPDGTAIHAAQDGEYLGYIIVEDSIKEDSVSALKKLRSGVKNIRIAMLTGDNKAAAAAKCSALGIDEYYSDLLPGDKTEKLEAIMETSADGFTAFVGDGINDAPVLSRADIGIAMGGLGSDAAIEAADIVIMDDKPSKLVTAIEIAKKTKRIAAQNIGFALSVKLVIMVLGVLGISSMWSAVFADVGVMVLAILNSTRILRV